MPDGASFEKMTIGRDVEADEAIERVGGLRSSRRLRPLPGRYALDEDADGSAER